LDTIRINGPVALLFTLSQLIFMPCMAAAGIAAAVVFVSHDMPDVASGAILVATLITALSILCQAYVSQTLDHWASTVKVVTHLPLSAFSFADFAQTSTMVRLESRSTVSLSSPTETRVISLDLYNRFLLPKFGVTPQTTKSTVFYNQPPTDITF
jgi:hypothetical protein